MRKQALLVMALVGMFGCTNSALGDAGIAVAGGKGEVPAQKVVAVLDLQDLGPSVELVPLRRALARMLTTDLSAYGGIEVVARERVDRIIKETHLGESGLVSADSAQRAGRALAADYLVQGTFAARTDRIEVTLEIFDVAAGEVTASTQEAGAPDDVLALEEKLLAGVTRALKLEAAVEVSAPRPSGEPVTLAVLCFQNLGVDARLDPMEIGFADTLMVYLQHRPGIMVVEREQLNKVLDELGLQQSGLGESGEAARIGQLLGAQVMLLGSFIIVKDTLRFDAHLVAADTGALMQAVSVQAATADLDAPLRALADRVATALAAQPRTIALPESQGKTSVEAMLHFSRGEKLLWERRLREAAQAFQRCLYLDPDNWRALISLAHIHYHEYDIEKAAEVYERVVALDESLLTLHAPTLYYLYYSLGQYEKALRVVERAWAAGGSDERGPRFGRLVKWIAEANDKLGRPAEARRWYLLGINKCTDVRERLELRAYFIGSQGADAKTRAEQWEAILAETPPEEASWRSYWLSLVEDSIVNLFWESRDYERAKSMYAKILQDYSGTPQAIRIQCELARIAQAAGRDLEAAELFVGAAQAAPELDEAPTALIEAAGLYSKLGDASRAAALYQEISERYGRYDWRVRSIAAELRPRDDPSTPRPLLLGLSGRELRRGQSLLLGQLMKRGLTVHVSHVPVTREVLAGYSVAIFNCGYSPFDTAEVEAIRSFVAIGGGLLVNFDQFTSGSVPYDRLLSVLGIGPVVTIVSPWHVALPPLPAATSPFAVISRDRSDFKDLAAPYIQNGPHIIAPSDAVLATQGGHTVVAAFTYGLGRVVIAGLGQGLQNAGLNGRMGGPQAASANQAFLDGVVDWLRQPDGSDGVNAEFESALRRLAAEDMSGALSDLRRLAARHPGSRWAEEAELLAADLLKEAGDTQAAGSRYRKLAASAREEQIKTLARLNLARLDAASGPPGVERALEACWGLWREDKATPWATVALLEAGRWAYDAGWIERAQEAFDAVMNAEERGPDKIHAMLWAAWCREKRGDTAGAARIYRTVEADYPGICLVPPGAEQAQGVKE